MAFKTLNDINSVIAAIISAGGTVPQSMLDEQAYLQTCYLPNGALVEPVYDHLKRIVGYSQDLQTAVVDTVDKLMQTGPDAQKPGLLLGKIQSGKTRAFVGIMGRAFDKGFDYCVVLSKSSKALIEQTVKRMKSEFEDYIVNPLYGQKTKIAVYNAIDRPQMTQSKVDEYKNIFVAKKQKENIEALISMFGSPFFASKKLLIIDDEADFVSHAFRTNHGNDEVCVIAQLIDNMMALNSSSRYLQVTATPYSLYLQPDETVVMSNGKVAPFRPRFTTLVPIHSNYIGGNEYFVESKDQTSMYSNLFHPITNSAVDHLDPQRGAHGRVTNNATTTPTFATVREALMQYLVASAIRLLQAKQQQTAEYHSSFLMHVGTTQASHNLQKIVVDTILSDWRQCAKGCWTADMQSLFNSAYTDFSSSIYKGIQGGLISISIPSFQDVFNRVDDILANGEYLIQVVNSNVNNAKLPTLLDENGQLDISRSALNIFIGGFNLDRGVTIDHVLGFMYGRRPKQFSADTVLQHCRMYGNRSKDDMAVTRLHTTNGLHDILEKINDMDDQLREWFENYMKNPNYTGVDPESVFIQFNAKDGIGPCGRNRLLISDLIRLKSFGRVTPSGFQTDCNTTISSTIKAIDALLQAQLGYVADQPFLMDIDVAKNIIKMIRNTYIYNRIVDNNAGLDWDVNEMIAPIEYVTQKQKSNTIWVLHRPKARDMSRVRQNGRFVDAPEDGNTDTPLARKTATNLPILMLIREKGESAKGWRDAQFYWPCLRLPLNMKSAMYCKS